MFRKLGDRMTRYYPLLLQLYPTPESRPRQHEVLIEIYRKGKTDEAFRAFKKIYLQMVDDILDHLQPQESAESAD
jgi:DNA-binding GntR family transcriptional regulator